MKKTMKWFGLFMAALVFYCGVESLADKRLNKELKAIERKAAKRANQQVEENIAKYDLLQPLPEGFRHKMVTFPTHGGGRGVTHDPSCLCIKLRDAKIDFIVNAIKSKDSPSNK